MVSLKHRADELLHRDVEFPELRAKIEATPVVPRRGFAYPGVSADALRELRAADAPIPPTALRAAFDRPAPTWLPAIGLRAVPLRSIDDNLAEIRAVLTANPWALRTTRLDLGIVLTGAMQIHADTDWSTQLEQVQIEAIDALNKATASIRTEAGR